jgi:hypothetical protein
MKLDNRTLRSVLVLATTLGLACDSKDDGNGDDDALVDDGKSADDDDDGMTTGDVDEPASTTTAGPGEPPPGEDPPAVEACTDAQAARGCTGDGFEGTQYCAPVGVGGELQWGTCLETLECELGEFEHCGFCPGGGDSGGDLEDECPGFGSTCQLVGDTPTMGGEDDCNTPLVLSFDGGPVQVAPSAASTFDINATGACLSTDWPAATTPWLALDLDRSGSIESGRELFGSGTRLSAGGRASHGFAALEVLDDNRDGRIDGSDARFSELVLWADEDADKTATMAELTPVAMRGILSIDLGYRTDPRCDDRGNCEMQRAAFQYIDRGGEVRDGEVIDLYLSCQ